jgi:hypothetical protein
VFLSFIGVLHTAPLNGSVRRQLGAAMDSRWRDDPLLKGRFHPDFPDDLQVVVHDGGPRLTAKGLTRFAGRLLHAFGYFCGARG